MEKKISSEKADLCTARRMELDSSGRVLLMSLPRNGMDKIRERARPPIDQAHNFGCGVGC